MTMQQTRPVKYNFDNVFGTKGAPQSAGGHARSSYTADEVETIRSETFAQGKADTEAQAQAAHAAALGALAQGLVRLIGEFDATLLSLRHESAAAALKVGQKLAGAALDAFPLVEVEALLADVMHKLHREPRLVARVAPQTADALRADLDRLCAEHAFAGRVVVIAEPSLRGADCRIEWADGGIERDLGQAFAAIEEGAARWRSTTLTEES